MPLCIQLYVVIWCVWMIDLSICVYCVRVWVCVCVCLCLKCLLVLPLLLLKIEQCGEKWAVSTLHTPNIPRTPLTNMGTSNNVRGAYVVFPANVAFILCIFSEFTLRFGRIYFSRIKLMCYPSFQSNAFQWHFSFWFLKQIDSFMFHLKVGGKYCVAAAMPAGHSITRPDMNNVSG